MKSRPYIYLKLLLLIHLFPLSASSQYLGGDADGYASNILSQSVCPTLENTNVYFGGLADGFAMNTLTQSVCSPVENTNVFFGDISDGFATNLLSQSICPPVENTNVFFGGIADGFSIDSLNQTHCPDIPMPVGLASWNGQCEESEVVLTWITSSEINNDYFSIEKSKDAVNWLTEGKVKGGGTSNQPLTYQFKDKRSAYETIYYRLAQIDFTGKSEYSNVITVDCKSNNQFKIEIFPNPNSGKFTIQGFDPAISNELKIYNNLGELLLKSDFSGSFVEIDLSNEHKGVYIIYVYSQHGTTIQKVVVQ